MLLQRNIVTNVAVTFLHCHKCNTTVTTMQTVGHTVFAGMSRASNIYCNFLQSLIFRRSKDADRTLSSKLCCKAWSWSEQVVLVSPGWTFHCLPRSHPKMWLSDSRLAVSSLESEVTLYPEWSFQTDCLLFMLSTNKLPAFNSPSETEEATEPLCPVRALTTFVELTATF